MNEYKITYRTVEGNAQRFIVERTEAAARKQLKADVEGAEITDVELVDDNANATKAQERATLAKIKAMVAELGPQSYIATAFEGCFEIAEENIDDDAACSMKGRFELEAQRAIERGYEVDRLKAEVKRLNSGIDELVQKDDERKAALERLGRKVLSDELYTAIRDLAQEDRTAARQRMEESAETMAALAETPQDIAFAAAVTGYREAKKRRALCEDILTGLENMSEE